MPENEIISKPPLTKTLHENARLELCSELELGLKTRELLPKVFLDELNKPSMQIVLWQPPGDFVRAVVKELAEGNAEKEREMDNDTVEQHESRYLGESMTRHEEAADNVEFYDIQTDEMDL